MSAIDQVSNWYIERPEIVYGNDKWEIIDVHYTGQVISLHGQITNREIVAQLTNLGLLDKDFEFADLDIDGDEHNIYVTDINYAKPICRLSRALENNVRSKAN